MTVVGRREGGTGKHEEGTVGGPGAVRMSGRGEAMGGEGSEGVQDAVDQPRRDVRAKRRHPLPPRPNFPSPTST